MSFLRDVFQNIHNFHCAFSVSFLLLCALLIKKGERELSELFLNLTFF